MKNPTKKTTPSFALSIALSSLLFSACAVKTAQRTQAEAPPTPAATAAPEAPSPSPAVAAAPEPKSAAEEVTPQAPAEALPHKKDITASAHVGHADGIEPSKALGWLKNGNTRYLQQKLRKDGQSPKDVSRLAKGQHPHSIILSCSDSRVPPEVVFDQKLGEVFVVRNAGEVAETASIASMEYAAEHLGSRLILVMGHTHCGAVKAAHSTLDGQDAGTPALNALVKSIHPHLGQFKSKAPSPAFRAEVLAHVQGTIEQILKDSELIRKKVENGEIEIKPALYNMDTGAVEFP
jgi:carbonic anhydrase